MPIVQPRTFDALGLVPFQINPHYLDADPTSTHMGETRDQRLREYLEENDIPVVALREPAMLRIEDELIAVKGKSGARIFRPQRDSYEVDAAFHGVAIDHDLDEIAVEQLSNWAAGESFRPNGLAFAPGGDLYVSDNQANTGNRLLRLHRDLGPPPLPPPVAGETVNAGP